MLQKKICMLGAAAVGKTSLVSRFVRGIFSEKYLSTIGVKIDRKQMNVEGQPITLLLWDIEGAGALDRVRSSYLKGSSGYILVADGTRPETVDAAADLREQLSDLLDGLPFVLALNKADLTAEWDVATQKLTALADAGWTVIQTSARTGEGVERVFDRLARAML